MTTIQIEVPTATCARCSTIESIRPTLRRVDSPRGDHAVDSNSDKWVGSPGDLPNGWVRFDVGAEPLLFCAACESILMDRLHAEGFVTREAKPVSPIAAAASSYATTSSPVMARANNIAPIPARPLPPKL